MSLLPSSSSSPPVHRARSTGAAATTPLQAPPASGENREHHHRVFASYVARYRWRTVDGVFAMLLAACLLVMAVQYRAASASRHDACELSYYRGDSSGNSQMPAESEFLPCMSSPFDSTRCKVLTWVRPQHARRQPSRAEAVGQTAALCLLIKNEHLYLNEFVDYHLGIGIDEIFIYDNSPDFNLQTWAAYKQDETNHRIQVKHIPGINKQLAANKDCFLTIQKQNKHTWMGILDADEMLVMHQHEHVVDLLSEYCQSGALSLYWLTFGHSNQTRYRPWPLAKRFQYGMGRPEPLYKSFAKVSDIDRPDVHYIKVKEPAVQHDVMGTNLYNGFGTPEKVRKQANQVAAIYHFWLKSMEEWYVKACVQGTGYNATLWSNCGHSMAETHRLGTVHDDRAWHALKRFVPEYAALDQVPF